MKKKPKVPGSLVTKWVVDPSLDKYSGQVLFPEKLARANEMLSKIEHWPPELNIKKTNTK